MKKFKSLCLLLVLIYTPAIWSGQISPYLDNYLHGITTSDDVSVLVMFSEQADIQALNIQLKQERVTLAERNRRVIEALQEVATKTQPEMTAYFDGLAKQGLIYEYKTVWIANMALVKSTKAGVYAMATRSNIGEIFYDYPIESVKPVDANPSDIPLTTGHEIGLDCINAPAAWAAGFTGAGRVVANMDTGVDGTHPAFASRFRGDVNNDGSVDESWYDPYSTHWTFPQDSGIHGTHTMGTICGRTAAGDTIGVAIDAKWIAAGSIDRGHGVQGQIQDAILSFQWFADPDDDPNTQDNPDALNNSWGISPILHGIEPCDESFWQVIDNLEAAGTVVIFSAGNEGPNASTIGTPADRATTNCNTFCVGSIDGASSSLPISNFSSRGPSYCSPDGQPTFKPEVVAPGDYVRSSVPGGGYDYKGGTSMATPHVTGAIAVIRGVNPDLDADAIKEILMSTAHDLGATGEDNDYGHGLIDVYEACLVAIAGYGYIEGIVYDEDNHIIPNALIAIDGTARWTRANNQGAYLLGTAAGTSISVTSSYFGYVPQSAVVNLEPNATVTQNFYLDYTDYGALEGYATDIDENPLENVKISVVGTPLAPIYTNAEGYFSIGNIPGDSTYTIGASAAGYIYSSADIFIPVGNAVRQDFSMLKLESFETNDGYWVGSGNWEWGQPVSGPNYAYDGNNVWATNLDGDYGSDADDGLVTSYYTIDEPNASLTFYHWYNLEENYDGGNVSISIDGGTTWALLYPQGGYPNADVASLDEQPGYNGESGGYIQAYFDLSAYENQIAKFKFRLGTDGSRNRTGWYIDAIAVSGGTNWGGFEPEASITPTSMRAFLEIGDAGTLHLTINNVGEGILEYAVEAVIDEQSLTLAPNTEPSGSENSFDDALIDKHKADGLTYYNYIGPKSDVEHKERSSGFVTNSGGPDDFGYKWKDSNEADGPEYNWIDITGNGTPITNLRDDTNAGPFSIGFSFPYHGNNFSTFRFCTNGWISFTSTSTYRNFDGDPIPQTDEPNNLVAPFLDDLDFSNSGSAYYYSNGVDSLIVSYINAPHYAFSGPAGPYTFQVILLASGDIIFQYSDINDPVDSYTMGIENEDGTIGLQMVNQEAYADSGLAVQIYYPVFWLTVDPIGGAVAPNNSTQVNINFDATELGIGTYTGNVMVYMNDPNLTYFNVPCTLDIVQVGIGDEADAAIPSAISLNQNYPNPFNPQTEIAFGLPNSDFVNLEVYDVMGRKVTTLVNEEMAAGVHRVIWNGTNDNGNNVSSGVYFYRLTQSGNTITKKMIMLK